MIRIDMKRDAIAVGEHISGQAVWNSSGDKQARKLSVICLLNRPTGSKEESVMGRASQENAGAQSQIVVPFDFEVPFASPVTYDGTLFHFRWEIIASADIPWAIDESQTKVFTVHPAEWTDDEYRKFCHDDDDVNAPSSGTGPGAR